MAYNPFDFVGTDKRKRVSSKAMDLAQGVIGEHKLREMIREEYYKLKEVKLTEAETYVVFSPLLKKVYDGPVSEKEALRLIKKYAKQGQYHVAMIGTKYYNKSKLGKKNPVKEGKLTEASAYKTATRNELAMYITQLSNTIKGTKDRKMLQFLKRTKKEVSDELKSRKKVKEGHTVWRKTPHTGKIKKGMFVWFVKGPNSAQRIKVKHIMKQN